MANKEDCRIGIDLGGTKIEGAALDRVGNEVIRRRIPSPQGDYRATVAAVSGLVAGLAQAVACAEEVGVGIPGAVSPKTGLVKNANSTWLIGHPFASDLAQAMGRPVRVENDANCFALSEATDGAAQGFGCVFGVILGTGVGGGLVIKTKTHIGANAIAGEWGHNPLPWPADDERPGPPCYCGKYGCIETFLSGPGLAADHKRTTGEVCEAAAIAERADAGDAACRASLDRHAERLAKGLAMVINVIDPDAIILGGGISNIESLYRSVPARWGRFVFSDDVRTPLLRARHGDASGVRGAARLWP
jgi:fructokinase